MPLVSYYLGRPAHVWIAAMSRRGPARKAGNGSGVVRGTLAPGGGHPQVQVSRKGTLSPAMPTPPNSTTFLVAAS
jgi:hypothetical protein